MIYNLDNRLRSGSAGQRPTRLRSGSAGHRPTPELKNEDDLDDDGGEPIQVTQGFYIHLGLD